jgi:hypothetical protein
VTSALQPLRWLPIKKRIEFKICLLFHRTINGQAPTYLKEIIARTTSIPGRAANLSADNKNLVNQRTKLKFGQRVSSVAGPRIWNQLLTELKTRINTAPFKHKLETYAFSAAYLQLHYFTLV